MCALCPEFLCPKFLLIFLQTEEYFGLYKILGCIRYMTSLTQTVNSFNAKQIKFYFVIKSWCEDWAEWAESRGARYTVMSDLCE